MHEIRMQHPGKNALGTDLIGWLDAEIARAGDQPILLTGSGDAFSAGLDLKEIAGHDRAGMERMLRKLDALYARFYLHPAPTVALVNGHAIAGGCVLALCCDARVAVDDPQVRIGLNELALGACIPPLTFRIVRRRIPLHTIDRVVLGAGLFAPAEALQLGLVDEVAGDAESAARKRLQTLCAHPRASYAIAKRVLRADVVALNAEDERRFREGELPLWSSREMRERVTAVLQRR